MKDKLEVLKKYVISVSGIFASIIAAIEVLEMFGIITVTSYGVIGFLIIFIISIAITFILQLIKKAALPESEKSKIEDMKKKIRNRMGVLKSSEKQDDDVMDSIHTYSLIKRMDILDYSIGDYMSVRTLQGKNASKSNSTGIVYKESTDSKTKSTDLILKAIDLNTGKVLKVEFFDNANKVYEHKFRINFTTPIMAGGEFNIMYFMKIPDELDQLSNDEEMMSISLNRYKKKLEQLEFGVYLNFVPSAVETYTKTEGDDIRSCKIVPSVENVIEVDIRDEFKEYIKNAGIKSLVRISCSSPEKITYILNYKK